MSAGPQSAERVLSMRVERPLARRPGRVRAVWRFFRGYPSAALGAAIVLAFVGLAIGAEFVHDRAYDQDLIGRLTPPAWQDGGTAAHPLGTDTLGRDVLARIMTAVRISLEVSVVAVVISAVFGVLLGMVAGYTGGWLDDGIMRITDAVLAFPLVLLAISVIAVLGTGIRTLVLVIAFTQWMTFTRTARAETLVLREQQFVLAVRSLGAKRSTILFKHVLPHLLPSMIALATLNVSIVILLEAGLSYLGLGVQLPDPSLGSMLAEGRQYITRASWLAIWPGVALVVLVLGINLLGNGVRSYLTPQSRTLRT
jgi:ABC-type dipeptide/oligopeptide/nickel transport system permease subunit